MSGDRSHRIDYQRFVEDALRDAVRRLMAEVAEHGLPGEHHFYIVFRTTHPGVGLPRSLRDLYPEEMPIILQNQFWNLEVDADFFSVELSFSGMRQRLTVPFLALTTFADPSMEFALRFSPSEAAAAAPAAAPEAAPGPARPAPVPAAALRAVSRTPRPAAKAAPPVPAAPAAEVPATGAPAAEATEQREPGEVIRFDPSRRR